MHKKRVFLFGIDGLTFRILNPLREQGLLPNFQKLHEAGVQALLKSTVPPLTPPAWMSMATGLSPAKHGVYDFWQFEQGEHGPRARVQTHRLGGKAIWNVLSELGRQVVVANVPFTYPPEPINGIMISGYMAPGMGGNVTFPASFREELLQAVPGYQIDLAPAVGGGQVGDVLSETVKMTHNRVEMLRLLLTKPWDFFFITFTGADRIQHLCWEKVLEQHPLAVAYYQQIDEALGLVLDVLGTDGIVMVVSDHGFQGITHEFYLQEYLYRRGLLRVRDEEAYRRAWLSNLFMDTTRKGLWRLGLRGIPTASRRWLYRLGLLPLSRGPAEARIADLDWTNTHAWVLSRSGVLAGYADIYLDDSLSEQQIDELAAALQEVRHPETGRPLVAEIHREDVFGSGPFASAQRHLILICSEETSVRTELAKASLWNICLPYGSHHPDGVLYIYGAGVKCGEVIAPAHVYDIVPTILSYMNVPLFKELDGRVLDQAFVQSMAESMSGSRESVFKRKLREIELNLL